jgi:hypothetical protein
LFTFGAGEALGADAMPFGDVDVSEDLGRVGVTVGGAMEQSGPDVFEASAAHDAHHRVPRTAHCHCVYAVTGQSRSASGVIGNASGVSDVYADSAYTTRLS